MNVLTHPESRIRLRPSFAAVLVALGLSAAAVAQPGGVGPGTSLALRSIAAMATPAQPVVVAHFSGANPDSLRMKAEVFGRVDVQQAISARGVYVCYEHTPDKASLIAELFISVFPTVLFVDGAGRQLSRLDGPAPADLVLGRLAEAHGLAAGGQVVPAGGVPQAPPQAPPVAAPPQGPPVVVAPPPDPITDLVNHCARTRRLAIVVFTTRSPEFLKMENETWGNYEVMRIVSDKYARLVIYRTPQTEALFLRHQVNPTPKFDPTILILHPSGAEVRRFEGYARVDLMKRILMSAWEANPRRGNHDH